jgi:hypothetical protein
LKHNPDHELLKRALEKVEEVNQYVNKCRGELENTRKLDEIQNSITGCEVKIKIFQCFL